MERTTIMLPTDLKERSIRLCRKLGVSFGEFVRTALARATSEARRGDAKTKDPLFRLGVWSGPAPKDLSTNSDQYLFGED